MGTYTKNLKLETPSYTDNADIPALAKKNNEIIDSEMIKRANGLDYNEQTGVLQLTGNNSKVGSPIQIKNNLPVTSMSSGTELKINNYKGLIKFTKEGKSTQETRSGKNLLNLQDNTRTSGGLTITTTDNEVKIVGTGGTYISSLSVDFELKAGTYTFSATNNNYNYFFWLRDVNDTTIKSVSLHGSSQTITLNQDIQKIVYGVENLTSSLSYDITTNFQIEEGNTATPYEEYTGGQSSPNPDYPSEIISIPSVENLLQTKEETITSSGVNIELKHENLKAKGTTNGSILYRIMNKNILLKAGTYTFSWVNKGITPLKDSSQLIFSKSSTDRIVTFNLWTTTNYKTITFTEDTILDFNYCYLYVNNNNSIDLDLEIMIEKGTIAHPWRPYGNYLRIDNVSKNLFDKDSATTQIGYFGGDGTINSGGSSTITTSYTKIVPNIDITISGFLVNRVLFYDENMQFLERSEVIDRTPYTFNKNAYYIRVQGVSELFNLNILQIEKGSIATEYEPYRNKVIYVNMQDKKLCSNKDETIKDELIIYDNGKTEINKKIGEVVFTGDENIISDGKTSNYYRYKIITNLGTFLDYPTALCTHFIYNLSYTADASHFYVLKTGEMLFFSDKSTLDEFKNWLKVQYDAGTPVKVQYELAEPKVIDLGEVDFDLIENSTLTCEEESDMQIDYLTISSNIFVQDSLDGNSSQKAPSINAVNEIISKLEARIIALENKNV